MALQTRWILSVPGWRIAQIFAEQWGAAMEDEVATLPGPHRHNWLNADGQGVDARRHVAFRSGSPKSLRAPRAVVTRFLAHARFQTAPTSLLTLQTCGGGLRLGRVKIMNSRSGTAACIGRAGLLPLAAPAPSLPLPAGGYGSRGRPPDTTGRAVPLTGFSEGVLGGRLQATHCGSPQSRSRTNIHKDQPTMPAGTTPPSSPTPDTQRLHLPNSTEGSRTLNPATLIPPTWRGGTTSRLPLTAHNAGDSSRNDKAIDSLRKQELSSRLLDDAECAPHQASRVSSWA
ncbi:hypothetical protein THAOC_10570 [Thalassiosira oceanica]|uniref:Uncharacterized protein n=1 Tax=Thalassiosira oceanica TaxID=159749 RepID=K0TCQ6_THAOC|nr:hypothetical protein THAOC_10570 [Thalassiosira oceanica]|eukprot:EJK68267.1 hypothetical protein THAOC_10570 [Thalassiosira oceanica]